MKFARSPAQKKGKRRVIFDTMLDMELDVKAAVADIEATPDLLERALRKEVERG